MDGDKTVEKWEAGRPVTAEVVGTAEMSVAAELPEDIEMPMADETIKEFIASVERRFCPNCGRAVADSGLGRKRVFCSDACRVQWWNRARAVRRKTAGGADAKTEV